MSHSALVLPFLLVLAAAVVAAEPAAQPAEIPAVLRTVRGGLPNVAAKLAKGEAVTVVVLGGSITQGGGADGYVAAVGNWLKEAYPASKTAVVNAGIGGTGSDFGAKRYDRDVLKHKPDLVLIEFAVNDGSSNATVHMERMVHKTWLASPATDLAFFYTLHKAHLPSYQKGVLPTAAAWHDRVAEFYGIPTFSPAFAVVQKLESKEMAWEAFSRDACHPSKDGYAVFNQAFRQVLPEFLAAGKPGPHALGRSITPGLQPYPPALVAKPVEPVTLVTAGGATAARTWPLPQAGINWLKEPAFSDDEGRVLWRISWMPANQAGKFDATTGADRSKWENNAGVWFEEDGCFTGSTGQGVFAGSKGGANFGAGGGQFGVLRFIAPRTGRYALRLGMGGLALWENADRAVGINVLRFAWDGKPGSPVLRFQAVKDEFLAKAKAGWIEQAEVELAAGEELAFIADTNAPGWLSWRITGLSLVVGLLRDGAP